MVFLKGFIYKKRNLEFFSKENFYSNMILYFDKLYLKKCLKYILKLVK